MKVVATAPLDADLSGFSRWLFGQGITHRIAEEQGRQVVLMAHAELAEEIQRALDQYLQDADFKTLVDHQKPRWRLVREGAETDYPRASFVQAPVIFICILLSVLVAWVTGFGSGGAVLRALLIVDPFALDIDLNDPMNRLAGLGELLSAGELWRLFSPDFLHFSVMHISFNMVMLYVLGGQLEIRQGSLAFLSLAAFVSIVSNIAQLLDSGYLFGGFSGVVYGLVGYCWIWRYRDAAVFLPDALLKFALVWLAIGYTPLTESLGWGKMANSAHLYGLLSGLVWGWLTVVSKKAPREFE